MSDPLVVAALSFATVIAVGGFLVFVYDFVEARLSGAGRRGRVGPRIGSTSPRGVGKLVTERWRIAIPSGRKTSASWSGRTGSAARRF